MAGGDEEGHAFVVMAYGDSPFLAGCLAGLRAQDRPSPIVVTTSTPSPFIAAAAAAAGAPVIVNPRRAGIASDWNFALAATPARFVTLAHQDDTYAPAFARESLAAFAGHGAVLCFTSYQEIDDAGAPVSSKVSKAKHLIEFVTLGRARVVRGARLRAFLSVGNALPCSAVTYDRRRLGAFAFSDELATVLDWDAWWRLMEGGEAFVRAPQRLVGRRHNALTATSKHLADGTRLREDQIMFRRIWGRPFGDLVALAYRAGY
jgi:hypothetical protein